MKALTLPVLIPDREGKVLVLRNILQVPFDRRIFGSIEMKENIRMLWVNPFKYERPKKVKQTQFVAFFCLRIF